MNKFNVGDSVEVLSSATDMEELQASVGHSYKVSMVCDDTYQPYKLSNGWWYRECELKLIEPVKVKFPHFNPYVKDIGELTQAELQFLTDLLSVGLREYSEIIKGLKEDINSLWNACDGTEDTSDVFNCLNAHKDDLKASKAFYKKLSEIQRKLKKQVGK